MSKKINILRIALCVVLAVCFGVFGTIAIQGVLADEVDIIFQDDSFKEEYVYGDTIVVPSPTKVKIQKGQTQTQAVSVVLTFPDGNSKGEGSYLLDKAGKYTLTYYNANGLSATKEFLVNKRNYGISQGSTAVYDETIGGKEGVSGVAVTLKDEGTFSFNKTINLYEHEGSALDVCTIYPFFRKATTDDPIVTTVSVKIVDCYDENKFVEIYVWCPEGGEVGGAYYLGAGASNQVLTGLEQNEKKKHEMTEEYEGELYKIHRPQRYQPKTAWGRYVNCHYDTNLIANGGITISWDLSTHVIKAATGGVATLITDIDSSQVYGVNTFDFKSFFTTGEAYVNVTAYNYSATYFEFALSKVFGYSQDELKDGTVVDNTAPSVAVDVETTEANKIYLQKGVEFTLPEVSKVVDQNYYGKNNVLVYRNYGKPGQAIVNVQNGKIKPSALGSYSAVYTAFDSYGNGGTFVLEMIVVDQPKMSYVKNSLTKLVGAKVNVLPRIDVVGINNAVETEVIITDPSGAETKLYYNGNDGYEYIPKTVGDYKVTYIFKDNVYVEEYSYDVSCVDENSAVFIKPFSFPAYFVKGATYSIGQTVAYSVGNDGFTTQNATVSVSVDGKEFTTLTNSQINAFKIEAENSVQFKASYGNNTITSKLYEVIDVGFGKVTTEKDYLKYMQGNYDTSSSALTEDGAKYSFTEDASLQFINKISSGNFSVKFNLSAEKVSALTLTLRDAKNPDGDYVSYTIEKGLASTMQIAVQKYEDYRLALSMVVPSKYTSLTGNFAISQANLGMDFDGLTVEGVKAFETDGALFEMGVLAENGCVITISQINNQSFTVTESMRESKPQIKYKGFNGITEVGVKQQISVCYASSVFGAVLDKDVVVSVLSPSGEIITSVDGIRLENVSANVAYVISLEAVGQYRVEYKATLIGADKVKTQKTLETGDYYIINVSESQAPEIKFKDGSNENTVLNLKVGAKHKVKEFTVTDNVSSGENIKVYTMILDTYFTLEENGYGVSEYTFKRAGAYIVYVLAYDEFGNSSCLYYNVVVS